MKKLLSIIALLAIAAFPLTFAKADANLNYSKGELVSFKQDLNIADDDDAHIFTMIAVEDSPAGQQYARVWSIGISQGNPDGEPFATAAGTSYKTSTMYIQNVSRVNEVGANFIDKTTVDTAEYITLDELKSVFTMTESNGEWVVDMSKVGDKVEWLSGLMVAHNLAYKMKHPAQTTPYLKGFYTSTLSADGQKVYALDFTYAEDGTITAMKAKLVPVTSGEYVPALVYSADKTFDCKGKKKLCYLCNGEYLYQEEGTQDPTCTIAADKPTENDCVTNAKTGTREYIIEGLAVIGVAIVTLAVLKRKDLFRNI